METTLTGACIIGRVRIKEPAIWAQYLKGIPATLIEWQGTLVTRGTHAVVLTGEAFETDMVVIRFPDMAAIESWYRSPAYQALIPLRDASADVVIVGYEL